MDGQAAACQGYLLPPRPRANDNPEAFHVRRNGKTGGTFRAAIERVSRSTFQALAAGLLVSLLLGSQAAAQPAADSAYLRVTVVETQPPTDAVQLRLAAYQKVWERLCDVGLSNRGGVVALDARDPWRALGADDRLAVGAASAWIDLSELLAEIRGPEQRPKPGQEPATRYLDSRGGQFARASAAKILAFTARGPELPDTPASRSQGNLAGLRLRLEWATAPDPAAIVARVEAVAEQGPASFVVPILSGSLASDAPGIEPLETSARRRLAAVEAAGVVEQPLAKRFLTSSWVKTWPQVYDRRAALVEAEIVRLLGCNVAKGIDAGAVTAADVAPLGLSTRFLEVGGPPVEIRNPFLPGRREAIRDWLAAAAARHKTAGLAAEPEPRLFIKVEDEPHLLGVNFGGTAQPLLESPEAVAAFRGWLRDRGVAAADLGLGSLADAVPSTELRRDIARADLPTPAEALRYRLTVEFLQDTTADFYAAFSQAARDVHGRHALTGTCVPSITYQPPFFTYTYRPDHFLWSRRQVMDVQLHHYTRNAWQTAEELLLYGHLLRSAAKFGGTKAGVLWGLGGPTGGNSTELAGMSALIRDIHHFYQYYYEPTQHPWTDRDVAIHAAMARIYQLAGRIEGTVLDGDSPVRHAPVALLHSRGSEVWTQPGVFTEHRMLAGVLSGRQVPFDVLPEEEFPARLENYRVAYLLDPHLDPPARAALAEWVRAGGVLWSVAGAGLRDGLDAPGGVLDDLLPAGSTIELVESPVIAYSEIRKLAEQPRLGLARFGSGDAGFDLELVGSRERLAVAGAEALAATTEGEPAVIRFAAGKGTVIRVGTMLGAARARSAEPPFSNPVAHDARRYDEQLDTIYLLPLEIAGLERPLQVSPAGIDATFFHDDRQAVVLLANYRTAGPLEAEVRLRLPRPATGCETLSGEALPVRTEGAWTVIDRVPVSPTQAVFLTAPGSPGQGPVRPPAVKPTP